MMSLTPFLLVSYYVCTFSREQLIMSDTRLSWDVYFMHLAEEVAGRSTCLRRHVGAVAVDSKTRRILGTGYNGNIPQFDHCTKDSCVRIKENIPSGQQLDRCMAVHAEQNIVLTLGIDKLQDTTFYCTHRPCTTCIKLLLSCGLRKIIWKHDYPDLLSMSIMQQYGTISIDENGFHVLTKTPV